MSTKFRITLTLILIFITSLVYPNPTDSKVNILDSIILKEIVVTGSRPSVNVNNLPMSVSVISEAQIERRMEQSILPLLTEQVPSLFIGSRGVMGYGVSTGSAGAMSMRGIGSAPTTQLLILIDGHPQYMGLMGHPIADSYQTLLAERIEVVRGPASVLYGSNAMGGVINIITKQQKTDGVHTHLRAMYGSYNTATTELSNAIRSGKFNSFFSFGYNHSDGHRKRMGFDQYTGYVKIGYDFSRQWKSFVDIDITNYESSNPGSVDYPMFDNDMDVTRGVTSFSLQNNYDKTSGALKFYYNFGIHKINDGYATGGTPKESRFRSKDKMLGITFYQNYSLFSNNQTTIGVDYQHFGGHAWTKYLNGNPNNDIADETLNEVAGYINFQQTLFNKLTVNAGVRVDHHTTTGTEWIPQFGLSYFATDNTILKAIVSKGFRNPTIREMYMFGPQNPDLAPESLMNYEFSLSQSFLEKKLLFGFNFYYIKGKNTIVSVERPGQSNLWMNTGKIRNNGIELTANYQVKRNLNINSNYSYLHMKYDVEGAPEHKLYAGFDYNFERWTFSSGVQFIHNLIKEEGKETFTLWNARLNYKTTSYLDIFARGENLLAQKYEINDGYPLPRATVFGGFTLKF